MSDRCRDYAVDTAARAHIENQVVLADLLADEFRKTKRSRSEDRWRDHKAISKPGYSYVGRPSGSSHRMSLEVSQFSCPALWHHGSIVVSHLVITQMDSL